MVGLTENNSDISDRVVDSLHNMSGEGNAKSPYIITNIYELQAMKYDLSAKYKLAQDIDANETMHWNNDAGFEPIGKTVHEDGKPFHGHLDGNGKTIKNITIRRPETHNVGLFGVIGDDGMVKNLTVKDSQIQGNFAVGTIVGYNKYGNIVNTTVNDVNVTGENLVGGFAGWNNDNSTLFKIKCKNTVVFGEGSIGGIAGENSGFIVRVHIDNKCAIGENDIGDICGGNEGYLVPNPE